MNIDQVRNAIAGIFSAGTHAIEKFANPKQPKADPISYKQLSDRLNQTINYVTSKPSEYMSSKANQVISDFTPSATGVNFNPPFQQEMRQIPTSYEPFAARMNQQLAYGTDWAKRIAEGAGQFVVNGLREIPRGGARIGMALHNPDLPYSITPKSNLEKFVYGDQPIDSYNLSNRKIGSDFGLSSSQIDKTLPAVTLGGLLLDAPIGLDSLGKAFAKNAGESAIKTTAKDAGEVILKKMGTKERLSFLMNYGKELLANGFTREQVDKIGVKEAATILKNDIRPESFAANKAIEQPVNDILKSGITAFKEWIGSRSASKWEGIVASKKFAELDQMGQEGIKQIESGNYRKEFQFVRDYFDQARQRLIDSGISIGKVQDYLPHMWQQTDKEAEILLGRKLSQNTPFSLQRLIKTYSEGIDAGLTPKFNTVSDLVGAYETSINKVIADRQFFSYLKSSNLIKPTEKAAKDWVTLNPDRFPVMSGETSQVYKASPKLAEYINNYLDNPNNMTAKVANLGTDLKNIILSAGVPHTGINSMGAMTLVRNTLATDNPVKGFLKATQYIVNPASAEKVLNSSIDQIPDAVRHGLTVSNEDYKFIQPYLDEAVAGIKGGANKLMGVHSKLFEKDIFEKILPALKIQNYQSNLEHLLKSLPETEAKQAAAEITNNFFGGMNLDFLLRNKDNQNWLRTLALAPDLYESQGRVGIGVVKSLFKPGSPALKAYRVYARNLVMFRLSTELLNKATSGHFQFENRTGNKFNIETSYYDSNGKQLVIKVPGIDWLKIPTDLIDSMAHGDTNAFFRVLRNRMSVIASAVASQLTNTKWNGQPITTKDMTPGEQLLARGTEGAASITPSYISTALRATQGNQSIPETLTQLTELPAYWQGGAYSKADLKKVKIMHSGGATGQEINSALNPQNDNVDTGKPTWNTSKGSETTSNVSTIGTLKNFTTENAKSKEKNKTIQTIFETLNTDEQIAQALEKNGISYREGVTYMISQLGVENGQRGEMIMSMLNDTKSKEEFVMTAGNMAKDGLLTTAVTAKWLADGVITASQKKQYDNLIKGVKGQKVSSGTGSSSKALPANTKLNIPSYKTRALNKLPTLKSLQGNKTIATPKLSSGKLSLIKQLDAKINAPAMKVSYTPVPAGK